MIPMVPDGSTRPAASRWRRSCTISANSPSGRASLKAQEKAAQGNTRQAINERLYCPTWQGQCTHIHAAYTAIGLILLEQWLPKLVGKDMSPFTPGQHSGGLWQQCAGGVKEHGVQRMMRARHDAHAARVGEDGSADLEQLDAHRGGGCPSQFGAGERDLAQALHQRAGKRGEHQAQPVGEKFVGARAGAEEIELHFLDAVLSLAALAVEPVVEHVGGKIEIGHHKAP